MTPDLPPGWRVIPLRDAGLITRRPSYFEGTRPYLATADVDGFELKPAEEVSFDGRPARADLVLSEGDVLQAKMKATNKAVLVRAGQSGWLASTGFAQFCPDPNLVEPSFLFHVLASERFCARRDALSVGSTQQAISDGWLGSMELAVCDPWEQRRIAAVLDVLDELIRRTEQIIAKLHQIERGLLHDLLTRGVDENGSLRPLPDEAPHLYKETAMGRLPRSWSVKRVEELLALVMDFRGRTPKKLGMDWGGGDIPALSARNVRMGGIDFREETYYGSRSLYDRWMTKGDARIGDVLLTTEAPLGNVTQVPESGLYILSQRVVLLRFAAEFATNDFMAMQIAEPRCQTRMRRWSSGTTATGIQMAKMVLIPLVVPPVEEQEVQAAIVRAASERLATERDVLEKLKCLQSGLVSDLLTGRVRVPAQAEASK